MSNRKIEVDFTTADLEAGKHWLSKPTKEELKQRLEQIRAKNREKYWAQRRKEKQPE